MAFSAASLALSLAVAGSAVGQTLVPAKPPDLRSYTRTFRTAADILESAEDPRLDLPSGSGTIEFWAGRNWPTTGASELYCVVANGASGTRRSAADVDEPVFEPRYAIYLSQQYLYFQSGDVIHSAPLSHDPSFDFQEQRAHFAVVIRGDEGLVDVFVNGQPPYTIENVKLKGKGVRRVTVGGTRSAVGKAQLTLGSKPSTLDLTKSVKPYKGAIADLRIWSKDFDPAIFEARESAAPIVQRNQEHIEQSLAFPYPEGASNTTKPSYSDLVLYSSFRDDVRQHALSLHYPLEGHWLNASRIAPRMDTKLEELLGDSLGNVVLPWSITILPATPDRAAWVVYLDSLYIGYIADSGDEEGNLVFVPVEPDGPEREFKVEGDELRVLDGTPSTAFGGEDGRPASTIRLIRPSLAWRGTTMSQDDPFWASYAIPHRILCYKAYNPPLMPSRGLHLGAHGNTGSAEFIFKEPERADYRWDSNIRKLVPNNLTYIDISTGAGKEISSTAFNEQEVAMSQSMKFGTSFNFACIVTYEHSATGKKSRQESAVERGEAIETTSSLLHKTFALALNVNGAELDPGFVRRVEQLRDSTNPDHDYALFLKEVGTHYTAAVTYGALAETTYTLDSREVETMLQEGYSFEEYEAFGAQSNLTLSTGATATAECAPGGIGGSASVNVGVSTTIESKVNAGETTAKDTDYNTKAKKRNSNSTRRTYVCGTTTIIADGSSLTADQPLPLFFDLRPIYELLSPRYFTDPRIINHVRPLLKLKTDGYLAPDFNSLKAERNSKISESLAPKSKRLTAYQEEVRSRLAAYELGGQYVPPQSSLDMRLTSWTAAGPYLLPRDLEPAGLPASLTGDARTAERLLASRFLPQRSPGLDWILWSGAPTTPDGNIDLSGIETDSVVYFRSRIRVRRPVELTLRVEGSPLYSRVYVNGSQVRIGSSKTSGPASYDLRLEHGWNDLVLEKAVVTTERQPISARLTDDSVWAYACLGDINSAKANPPVRPETPVNLVATRTKDDAVALAWNYPLPRDTTELNARRFEVQRIAPTPLSVLTTGPLFVDAEVPSDAVYRVRVNHSTGWGPWSRPLVVPCSPKKPELPEKGKG